MKNNDLLESAFKNAFDRFEEPVSPKVWESVSAKINTPAPSGGSGSGAGASSGGTFSGSLGLWVAGGMVVAASVAGYFMFKSDPAKVTPSSTTTEITNSVQVNDPEPETITTPQPVQESPSQKVSSGQPAQSTLAASGSAKHEAVSEPVQNKNAGSVATVNPNASAPAEKQAQPTTKQQTAPVEPQKTQPSKTTTNSTVPNSLSPTVFDRYTPIITAAPSSGYAPLQVQLSYFGDAKESTWNTGDGAVSKEPAFSHTYTEPGSYTVDLVTIDPDGVKHVTKSVIEVKAPSMVHTIPNVFTPNGDGMNDRFEIMGDHLNQVEAAIFDKSGRQVYRWTGIEGGWDGTYLSGETAKEGTYFYVIFARGDDDRSYQFKGSVTLIR
ncbi:MAG TPA: gliding motility-associated C-terminal domain-containing protein [Bacteroidia bacterium]|nr:gliding motility-associated C-terminal domain-containing protein [Bacteroidia bacterium]